MININNLKVGDVLYIPSALYIDSPWRDICGGKAIIRQIDREKKMINFHGFENTWYSVGYIENQEEMAEKYGDRIAYRDI